ncbi:MAG: hypothetical protein O9267_06300 [Flavobacterium sp.]|uniref:hypothetical protein n=1 Tax=Flavobacterium sp. TaxID=239 RepID=UPI0022C21E4C|nr:hypothetical protein [Flavobacterium sp.]MCZ8197197.1 hypothetical protein [Flavobacterium sp.]
MKKIIFYALTLSVFVFGQAFAQTVAEQNLTLAVQSAENVKQDIATARVAINQLVKQLKVIGNPNAVYFANVMTETNDSKEANANDVDSYVATAQSNSSIAFSTAPINVLTVKILQQNDVIYSLTNQIVAAITSGNNTLALNLVSPLRSALTKQVNFSNSIITNIQQLQVLLKTYNVCLKLVDSQGNQAIDGGFGAQNTVTGEIFYPGDPNAQDYGYGNCFVNLPVGTYEFFSYPSQGSLCGTGSLTVTLSNSLVNSNGIVEINLVTWCE